LDPARVRVIGHSIETDVFDSPAPVRQGPLRLLTLGRTSPVKHHDTIIEAMRLATARGASVTLRIVGPSNSAAERSHRRELERQIDGSGLAEIVSLEPGVDRRAVPGVVADADVVVSATQAGSADKAVFEAMASRRPVLVSSPVFASLVEGFPVPLGFRGDDPVELADRIVSVERLDGPSLASVGDELRQRVVNGHSIDHWAANVVGLAEDLLQDRSKARRSESERQRSGRLERRDVH
jgi:glycosyltransferase involved in cell wall biosynthesis